MPTTAPVRFQSVTEAGLSVQNSANLVGTQVGECIIGNNDTVRSSVTLAGAVNNVPPGSIIDSFTIGFQAKRIASSPDPHTLSITASVGGFELTSAVGVSSTNHVSYNLLFPNPDTSTITSSSIDNLQLTFRLEDLTVASIAPQMSLKGVDSAGDKKPSIEVTYSPLRWARVLTSGSNFPVTTLTSTFLANPTSQVGIVTANSQGHLKRTGSIAFRPTTLPTPTFDLDKGAGDATILSQSLFLSSSTISASNIPNNITIPDSGDFRSDVLFHLPAFSITQPKGKFSKNPTIAVENILTYEGGMNAANNTQLVSGSTQAFFEPTPGNRTEFGFSLPGDAIGFTGVNSGDVGYADYNAQNNHILIERASPARGPDNDLQFFVTASFAIPYSSSFGFPAGLNAHVVRIQRDQDDRFISDPIQLTIGAGESPQIGMFTGSVVIPFSTTDVLIENEIIQLRIQNDNSTKQVHIGFTGSGDLATFELKDEFNANLRPSFYFDINVGQAGVTSFVGEAWSTYSGSLSGVNIEDIPPSQGLSRGNGILFLTTGSTGTVNPFRGQIGVTSSIKLLGANSQGNMTGGHNASGLTFSAISSPGTNQMNPTLIISGADNLGIPNLISNFPALTLTSSIADGDGLELNDSSNLNIINLKLNNPPNLGLVVGTEGVSIREDFDGDGLGLSKLTGVLSVVTQSQGGIELVAGLTRLALTSSLAGTGLSFNNVDTDRTAINVDYTYVITASAALTASVPAVIGTSGPSGPLFVGNNTPQISFATKSIQYSSSTDLNVLTYQYGFLTNMIHGTLSSISGSTLRINGDVVLGNQLADKAHLHSTNILLSSSFPTVNRGNTLSHERGGLIIGNNTTTTNNTGSAIFFDQGDQGNPFINWEFQDLGSSGWMLTTASSVIKQGSNTNPFNPSSTLSNPTSSFEHNDFVAHIQTAKVLNEINIGTSDPNNTDPEKTLYQTASMSNYGAICVINLFNFTDDSNVWMYVPESTT